MLTAESTNPVAQPRRRPHRDARRLYLLGGLLLLGMVAIVVRLVKLQIVDHGYYAEQVRRQYESRVPLQAERGPLYDRNGNLLASTSASMSFAVDPTHVQNPRKLAKVFATTFGEPYADWLQKITQRGRSFVWLRRKVTGALLDSLKNLDDDGLIKLKEPLRHFEYASVGAQGIGCTDIDNNGLNGVELFYNQQLRGTDGYIVMQRDARGHRRPDVDLPQMRPEHGNGLVLTLDINLQGIVEDELSKGVERAGAASGTAIALDPRTGEILAVASVPTYDPNDLRHADPAAIRVRAITDMYEPGSTLKVVTAAAALEEGVVTPGTMIDGEGGAYQLGPHVIRDEHPSGMMTFSEAMAHSSNIAFAKVAAKLSAPRFYKYVRDFGFGITSGVDLPGEARGDVKKPDQFEPQTQEFMSFGYQLAVTPLQLACAYAAVANGGVMMKPHLLKRRLDHDGQVIEEIAPEEIRRVVRRETADTLRDMLVGVVEHGTGSEARVEGLRIAGKTGTAQQMSGGSYSKSKYNASFVGYFPAEDPRIVLLVLLDSPTNGYYGGQVAAPIFREIARRIAGVATVAPSPRPTTPGGVAAVATTIGQRQHLPDLRGLDAGAARRVAEKYGYRVIVSGEGRYVAEQQPPAGSVIAAHAVVTLAMGSAGNRMPDLRTMSVRRAISVLGSCGIKPIVRGSGIVAAQSPPPGTPITGGNRTVVLECR